MHVQITLKVTLLSGFLLSKGQTNAMSCEFDFTLNNSIDADGEIKGKMY